MICIKYIDVSMMLCISYVLVMYQWCYVLNVYDCIYCIVLYQWCSLYLLYCYVSSLLFVCMLLCVCIYVCVYLYTTLIPNTLTPNTYKAITCVRYVCVRVCGLWQLGASRLNRLCISIVYNYVDCICVVYSLIFLHVIRLCTTLFYTIHLRRIGCVQYN